jgi:hypothetical protein
MTSSDDTHWWYRPTSVASLSQTLGGVHLAVFPGELRSIGLNEVGTQQVIQGKRTNWPHCNLCNHCSSPQNNYPVSEKLCEAFQRLGRGDLSPSPFGVASFERMERGAPRWVYRELSIPAAETAFRWHSRSARYALMSSTGPMP